MSSSSVQVVDLSFSNSDELLLEAASFTLLPGWTGLVGPNGAGKSTLVSLLDGTLAPSGGLVRLRARLEVPAEEAARYATWSPGERQRAQLAAALWRDPGVAAAARRADQRPRPALGGAAGGGAGRVARRAGGGQP